MIRDFIEAALLALILSVFVSIYWGILVLFFWILVCQRLRHRGLDSDYEHIDRDLFK